MTESAPRPGILNLSCKNKDELYAAYMPFVINGGLFITTNRNYEMGQDVFVLLDLMEETERLPIDGTVIWKTPARAGNYKSSGIGVQLSNKDDGLARNKIETYLAGSLESDRSTNTM